MGKKLISFNDSILYTHAVSVEPGQDAKDPAPNAHGYFIKIAFCCLWMLLIINAVPYHPYLYIPVSVSESRESVRCIFMGPKDTAFALLARRVSDLQLNKD